MFRFLFSTRPFAVDVGLLLLRVVSGGLVMQFGWQKMMNYAEWSKDFPDPLGISSPVSLAMTVFAEFFCSAFLVLGLFTRGVLIPLMFTMIVIIFIVHWDDPFKDKEHAISFLVPYIMIFLAGPGRYSMDSLIGKK